MLLQWDFFYKEGIFPEVVGHRIILFKSWMKLSMFVCFKTDAPTLGNVGSYKRLLILTPYLLN